MIPDHPRCTWVIPGKFENVLTAPAPVTPAAHAGPVAHAALAARASAAPAAPAAPAPATSVAHAAPTYGTPAKQGWVRSTLLSPMPDIRMSEI